jgi:hypothetical protein
MAYISTNEVKAIREALKAKYGAKFKFSVTRDHGTSVTVAIVSGDTNFDSLWAQRAPNEYGFGFTDINQYHITKENYGEHVELFSDINTLIRKAPGTAEGGREYFDKSDSMTDYFHTAFYYSIQVGKWNKPYAQVK